MERRGQVSANAGGWKFSRGRLGNCERRPGEERDRGEVDRPSQGLEVGTWVYAGNSERLLPPECCRWDWKGFGGLIREGLDAGNGEDY